MPTRQLAYDLFENSYYANVDRGDMAAAASIFDDEVEWSHAQVWAHHGFERGTPVVKHGRAAVEAYLSERVDQLKEARIVHHVRDMVFEDDRGAFLGSVDGSDGRSLPFMVWFAMSNERVARYLLRPL